MKTSVFTVIAVVDPKQTVQEPVETQVVVTPQFKHVKAGTAEFIVTWNIDPEQIIGVTQTVNRVVSEATQIPNSVEARLAKVEKIIEQKIKVKDFAIAGSCVNTTSFAMPLKMNWKKLLQQQKKEKSTIFKRYHCKNVETTQENAWTFLYENTTLVFFLVI